MSKKYYIPVRQQTWQEPVFSPEEGEPLAPTKHQVDRWLAEASNFPATLDEPPHGRRDWWDLLATRAYQAGHAEALAQQKSAAISNWQPIQTAPRDGRFFIGANAEEAIVCNWPKQCNVDYAPGNWRKGQGEWDGSFTRTDSPLTHWQELPEFPVPKVDP